MTLCLLTLFALDPEELLYNWKYSLNTGQCIKRPRHAASDTLFGLPSC